MAPFYGGLQSHCEETVYFLLFSSQEFLVINWSTSERWETKLMLKPPSGVEPKTSGLGILYLNHIVALDYEGAPWYLLEFSWIMLQYSVQTLCNILDEALCDKKKMKIAGNCCWVLLQRDLSEMWQGS